MRTIWKFPLRVGHWSNIQAGPGPVVLAAVDPASGAPAVWIDLEVGERAPMMEGPPSVAPRPQRQFLVVGTGREVDPGDVHVGSMIDRDYVWHVFERTDG